MRVVLFLVFVGIQFSAYCGGISKGFDALQQYNYFEAKKIFTKYLKKEPCAANYGLAIIYSRTDNPFHSLDSALVAIQISEAGYNKVSDKTKKTLSKYNFDYLHIADLRASISHEMYLLVLKQPSELGFDKYQALHVWAPERFSAIDKRDSLGYLVASNLNTSAAFQQFLDKYPESKLKLKAQQEFYRLQYGEKTSNGTLVSYMSFETAFPNNPYVADAQDQIYRLSTKGNTVGDYDVFIKKFSTNRNIEDAWRKLYQLYMVDFSKERIASFKEKYPTYPWMNDLEAEQALSEIVFLPYKVGGLFGWMDQNGNILIKSQYNNVGFFKDGLAWAEKSGKYGFVNKANKVIVPFQFESVTDFEKGRSIVEQNELYGCIDRTGAFTVPPQFKDLGIYTEGLMYAQKDSLYGYYDGFGNSRIQPQYTEAFSFENGKAKVIFQNGTGIIDQYGSYLIKPLYEELIPFSDSILVIESGDFYEFLKIKKEEKLPLKVDDFGQLNNDRALVEYDGKIGYINAKAELVIPFKFEPFTNVKQDGSFDGAYAKVAVKGKFGVIDRTGKLVIPAAYPKMGAVGTLIAIEKAGKWGFIDLNNQWKIQPIYEFAESFSDGLGFVQNLTLFGAINAAGKVVIPIEFTTINKIDKEHYNVTKGAKNGIYSNTGKQLVPAEYNRMQRVNEDWFALFKGTELHYFQLSTNTLVIPKL